MEWCKLQALMHFPMTKWHDTRREWKTTQGREERNKKPQITNRKNNEMKMFVSLYALTHIVILCSLNIFIAFYSIYLVFRFYCVLTICLCHIKKTYLICCLHFSLYSQSRIGKACSIPTRIEQYTATTTTTTTEHTTQSPIVLTTDLFFSLSLRMSFHGFSSHTYHCHTVAVSVCVLSFWAVYVAVTNHIQSETTGRGENLICHMATECADWLSHLNQWHFRDLSWQFLWHCLVTFMLLV